MGHSQRLRRSHVRAAFRLLGEVRELGSDTLAWRRHMVAGLCRLVDAPVGMGGEIPPGSHTPTASVDLGWGTARDRHEWLEFMAGGTDAGDPVVMNSLALRSRRYSRTRRQLVEDRAWYGTDHFELRRRAGLDDCITSSVPLPGPAPGWCQIFMLMRQNGQPFSPVERRVADLFHAELGRVWGGDAATYAAAAPETGLSPRLRQVLSCLLAGDGEKQAAGRLGLSARTVHNHVTALHRRFGVRTGAELWARCRPRPTFCPRLALDPAGPAPFEAAADGT
jgi:DNA-binding CsgD family transcriptional regulator